MKYKGFKAQDVELIAEMASLIGGTIWLGNQYEESYTKLSEVDLVEVEISK